WPGRGDVAARQVRCERFRTTRRVRGTKGDVGGGIEQMRVVWGEEDRVRPLEAIFEIPGAPAAVGFGPDRDNAHLPAAVIIAQQYPPPPRRTADCPRVDNIRVLGMDGNVAALRTPSGIAVAPENGPFVGTAGALMALLSCFV